MRAPSRHLVVVGASAGGVAALRQLSAALPAEFGAPVLIVLHIGAHESLLPDLIAADCALDVARAVDGEALRPGTIRIAPPDLHLTVEDGVVRLTRGPKENFARPAIDPLFRSAALDFDSRVIGVILTGMLDDGTAGLQAIKSAGGVAIVQDPADAVEPSMPASALRHVDVDHCVPLVRMPPLLVRLVASHAKPGIADMTEARHRLSHEQALSEGTGDCFEHLRAIADPSPLTCPECHGGLWQLRNSSPARYRCHTGHGYTARTLNAAADEETGNALWSALRALHERTAVLDQLAAASRSEGRADEAGEFDRTAQAARGQAQALRELLSQFPRQEPAARGRLAGHGPRRAEQRLPPA
jgi:two-component system, chemotaxis family, protein-glutamate methylesterase/glutaminase